MNFSGHNLKRDSTSKKKYRVAKRDMAEVSGEREERPVLKLINYGHGAADVSRQTEMEVICEGLMWPKHPEEL